MTELEAYLNGVVFEEEPAEESEEESEVGDLGEEANPENDEGEEGGEEENEEEGEDEDDEEEDEEPQQSGKDQGESAVAEIKKVSRDIRRTIKILGICRVRIEKTPMPPILSFEARKEVKKAKQIVKMKSSQFRRLEKRIKKKRTDLKAQFNTEKQKITTQQGQVAMELRKLDAAISAAWVRFWSKVKSIIAPALPIIAKVGLVVLLVLLVVGALFYVYSVVADALTGWESVGGSTGKDFYGVRLIYKDPEQEKTELLKTYGSVIDEAIENAEKENITIDLKIDVEIPEDYSTMLTDASSHAAKLVTEVAKIMYEEDQGSAPSENLTEILSGIKYFGINNGENENLHDKIVTAIWEYLKEQDEATPNLITTKDDAAIDENSVKTALKDVVDNNTIRTEKLFVEDVLYTSSDSVLSLKEQKDYEAIIYMPKTSLNFNYITMKATGENLNVKMYVKQGETVKELTCYYEEEIKLYVYDSGSGLNLTAQASSAPSGEQIKGALSEIGKLDDWQTQLQLAVDENDNEIKAVYTFNQEMLMVTMESETPFIFAEAGFDFKAGN